MSKLRVSLLVVLAVVVTFVAMPQTAASVSIDQLQLVGEAAGATMADGSCPTKQTQTCCQQSVHTGAFGTVPAPIMADGSCPTKQTQTCCQQSVHTGAFGTIPAPQVTL